MSIKQWAEEYCKFGGSVRSVVLDAFEAGARRMREECVKLMREQAARLGVLRSLQATYGARALNDMADELEKLGGEE